MGEVVPLPARQGRTVAAAIDAYLDAHRSAGAWSVDTAVKYRQTFASLTRRRTGCVGTHLDPGAAPSMLDTPAGGEHLRTAFDTAFGALAPATRAGTSPACPVG